MEGCVWRGLQPKRSPAPPFHFCFLFRFRFIPFHVCFRFRLHLIFSCAVRVAWFCRYEAPEVLFNPHLLDLECVGMADMLFNCINEADMDLRPEFYKHIVLSGGSTMYPGLPTRLEKDMRSLYLKNVLKGDESRLKKFKLNIEDPPQRKHMVYLGGSVLADIMKDNADFWISKEEWQEQGSRILDRK